MSIGGWFTLLSFFAFFACFFTSAWTRGSGWFIATVAALALFISSFFLELAPGELPSALLGAPLLFLFFFYVIAGHYITDTKIGDSLSHEALMKYIAEEELSGPLETIVRFIPAVLYAGFIGIIIGGAFQYLSK